MEQSTLLNVDLWSGREKKKREIGMARKRAENRERSLGFPGHKGLETIEILSQDNFAIAYTDGSQTDPSAMESSSSSQMVITTNTKLTQA
ncbi:hypothetical protein TNCV_3992901 [Trichonephila clavipes]|uniref:Uncharacterized protein n=1 Tax=Trichonephila clavipes TaxID=2585209 RepID=A0A8X6T6A2_TRICX|nr:hypothetical protein TNCV_3992901 [Trichonephila clavipes]